jgi:hypothetical protein
MQNTVRQPKAVASSASKHKSLYRHHKYGGFPISGKRHNTVVSGIMHPLHLPRTSAFLDKCGRFFLAVCQSPKTPIPATDRYSSTARSKSVQVQGDYLEADSFTSCQCTGIFAMKSYRRLHNHTPYY